VVWRRVDWAQGEFSPCLRIEPPTTRATDERRTTLSAKVGSASGSACGPVIVPVFKTGGWQVSCHRWVRHPLASANCAQWLRGAAAPRFTIFKACGHTPRPGPDKSELDGGRRAGRSSPHPKYFCVLLTNFIGKLYGFFTRAAICCAYEHLRGVRTQSKHWHALRFCVSPRCPLRRSEGIPCVESARFSQF